jgi:EAL domain-containing protein (putative c-di-GMP-specific phosphodiesterase class I)
MRLPLHEIKIDRSFVAGLGSEPDSGAIVRSAVGLGHNLGLRVVAEGVQERAAEAVLIEAGCDTAQGFLYGRPVAEADMTALLLTNPGSKGAAIGSPEREGSPAS